ncbi:MAG: hypothetical protein IH593_05520 [Bacteroidales bacterium]|nr:hypothetical protein [Bacteroidales bacterium]
MGKLTLYIVVAILIVLVSKLATTGNMLLNIAIDTVLLSLFCILAEKKDRFFSSLIKRRV